MAASQEGFINYFANEMFAGLKKAFNEEDFVVTYEENTISGKGPGYTIRRNTDEEYSFGITYYIAELLPVYLSGTTIDNLCKDIYNYVTNNIDSFTNSISNAIFNNINSDNFILMCMNSNDSRFNKDEMLYKTIGSAVIVLYTTFNMNNKVMASPVLRKQLDENNIKVRNSLFKNALEKTISHSNIQYMHTDIPGIYLVRDSYEFADGFYLMFKAFLNDICEVMKVDNFYIIPLDKYFGVLFTESAAKDVKNAIENIFKTEDVKEDDFYIPGVFHYDRKTREVTEKR